jgi:hypothetical protein
MRSTVRAIGIGLLALALVAGPAAAQADAAAQETGGSATDSAGQAKKKGGGLFGKAKKLAGNKAVQQVAKTVACTMVPGGQAVAGAIDAAASEDVGEAAAGAAGAAAGQGCMPGGMGLGPNPTGGGAAMDAAMVGMGHARSPGGAMAYGPRDPGALAACLGLTPEEVAEMSNPTGGEARQLTTEELRRQQELAAKMDMARYQSCATPQGAAGQLPPGTGNELPADGELSEAPGKSVALPGNLAADLKKGRATVRDIDWLAATGVVSEAGSGSFTAAMRQLAAGLATAGGTWRADIYLDKRYDDAAAAAIGAARLTTVTTALGADLDPGAITPGKVKKDKRPRLEIVREEP